MESIEQAIQLVSQFSELPFDALDWLELYLLNAQC